MERSAAELVQAAFPNSIRDPWSWVKPMKRRELFVSFPVKWALLALKVSNPGEFDTLDSSFVRASLDHPVGGHEQAGRHGQAERLRRFEIDDRFELGRRLHRKVGGLVAAQDAV